MSNQTHKKTCIIEIALGSEIPKNPNILEILNCGIKNRMLFNDNPIVTTEMSNNVK